MTIHIHVVDGSDLGDVQDVVKLFYAYSETLGIDLGFQNFDREMAEMPGKYAPPGGTLLLARNEADHSIGCVGLCPAVPSDGRSGCCEMKRLYVAAEGRGTGVGRALVDQVVSAARRLGYCEMLLDSMPDMRAAQALYRQAGFVEVQPYYSNPHQGVTYYSLRLQR